MPLSIHNITPRFTKHSFQSIEEYSTAMPHLNLEGYQLSKGDFNGESKVITTDTFQLGLRTADAKHVQLGKMEKGRIGMLFPLKELTYIQNGKLIRDDAQIIAYGESDFKTIYPQHHAHLTIILDTYMLNNYLSLEEVELFFKASSKLHSNKVSPSQKLLLTQHLHYLHTQMQSLFDKTPNALAYQDCYDSLVYALNDYHTYHHDSLPIVNQQREKILARALEYIHSTNIKELTISKLTKNIYSSNRTIQYCFSELLNITPKNYLIKIRLNCIRKELLLSSPSETTVTQIAKEYGVTNIGRFKQVYENFFNESPRETIRKASIN